MNMHRWLATIAVASTSALAADITLDPSIQYQTIEGFGAYGWSNGFSDQSYTSFLHDDLGVTMVRTTIPERFEVTNDNGDPSTTNLAGYNSGLLSQAVSIINGMKRFPDVRFVASIWTPPVWMKDATRDPGGQCSDDAGYCGGHLLASAREELAEYMLVFYKLVKQQTGVDLYGLSLQNEPYFVEPYWSCVYTPEEYRDALKAVGARFAGEGISVKLFGPEDLVDAVGAMGRDYPQKINADAAAKKALGAFAVHGYIDGINPSPTSAGSRIWTKVGAMARNLGVPLWMTETSGFETNWDGAMTLAANIHMALKYGFLTTWLFWADNVCSTYGLVCGLNHSERSLASKCYYRYVRPGAVMISAKNDTLQNPKLHVTAFWHRGDRTLTIVILNQGDASSVRLVGSNLPAEVRLYAATSGGWLDKGSASTSGSIGVDANSVTTLYGANFEPPVRVRAAPAAAHVPAQSAPALVYGVDGRLVRNGARPRVPGVYLLSAAPTGAAARHLAIAR